MEKEKIAYLEKSNERLQHAIKAANMGIWDWLVDSDTVYYSEIWKRLIGYNDDELENKFSTWKNHLHPDESEAIIQKVNDYLANPIGNYVNEFRFRHKNGSYIWVLAKAEVEKDKNGKVTRMFGSHVDITDKKETELKFEAISNQTTEGITVADMEGNYVFVNPAFCKMSGYTEKELLTMTVFDMKAKNQDHSSFKNSKEKLEGTPIRVNLQKKDGTEYVTEIIGDVITVNHEKLVLGTLRDITQQVLDEKSINKLNKTLETQVKERTKKLDKTVLDLNKEIKKRIEIESRIKETLDVKDVLLQEITHRVKNNLQVISSLINLQKANTKNDEANAVLGQTANRIHSMSLIHETLYRSNNFGKVKFKDYLESLIQYTKDTFDIVNVKIDLDIEDLILSVGTATNCGLIVMELITNSIKYAFPNYSDGNIFIEMKKTGENRYKLKVQDNGIGFPKDIDFNQTETLGMQLITSLTEQLEGTIALENENGTTFELIIQDNSKS